jgi:hypothetical protein
MEDKMKLKKILGIVSLVLVSIVIIWGKVGFYNKDLPMMGVLLVVGLGCGIASQKIKIEL